MMLREHFLYKVVDYDEIVDREVARLNDTIEGYTLYDLRELDDRKFKYPFFRVV